MLPIFFFFIKNRIGGKQGNMEVKGETENILNARFKAVLLRYFNTQQRQ